MHYFGTGSMMGYSPWTALFGVLFWLVLVIAVILLIAWAIIAEERRRHEHHPPGGYAGQRPGMPATPGQYLHGQDQGAQGQAWMPEQQQPEQGTQGQQWSGQEHRAQGQQWAPMPQGQQPQQPQPAPQPAAHQGSMAQRPIAGPAAGHPQGAPSQPTPPASHDEAMAIARRRLASGEITVEQFEEIRRTLGG